MVYIVISACGNSDYSKVNGLEGRMDFHNIKFKRYCVRVGLVWLGLFCFSHAGNAQETYILARAPQLSPTILTKTWGPFVKRLSEKTGHNIELKVYLKRADFERDLVAGTPDFIYGNPGYLIVANKRHGYIPLLRSGKKKLKGILVVRQDSPYKTLADLDGQTIVFPSPHAFAASLLVRSYLKDTFGIKYQARFVNSHDDVYRSVVYRRYAAGAGVSRTFNRESDALKQQLRILYETPGIKPHPLAAHPAVPLKLRTAVQNAVIEMSKSDTDNKYLQTIKLQQPVKADFKRDYLPLQKMALEMYDYLVK